MSRGLVVILSDEHRWDAMSCAGHPFLRTPNLDALAEKGTRFARAYTPSPICVPARAAFATGRHVHETGHWDNSMPYTGTPESWGHVLQRAGVRCESIGKLHYRDPADPVGFDAEHIPMMVKDGVGMVFASIRREEERISPEGRMLGEHIGGGESDYTRYDAAIVERSAQWFADQAASGDDAPWCLYVGLVAPHFPLVCPEPFFSRLRGLDLPDPKLLPRDGYVRHPWVEKQNAFMDSEASFRDADERRDAVAAYWGLCEWLDHNIGRILDALDQSGLDADVIYASDHGDNAGARGLWGKSNMYDESVRVPLICTGPSFAAGAVCETPVSLLDLSQTIPAHFGLDWQGERPGRPLADIAAGDPEPEREILSQYHAAGAVSGAFMLVRGRWKLIDYIGFEPELFDLDADQGEQISVAEDHPEIVAHLRDRLAGHVDTVAVNAAAFRAQDALVAFHGGRDAALKLGARGATPAPSDP